MWGEVKFDYKMIWTKIQWFSTKIKLPFSFFALKLGCIFRFLHFKRLKLNDKGKHNIKFAGGSKSYMLRGKFPYLEKSIYSFKCILENKECLGNPSFCHKKIEKE